MTITPAQLLWVNDNQPQSILYDDIYFSSDSGLLETKHTFINGNNLPNRFSDIKDKKKITIGETGFGTGLNFLATCLCFDNNTANIDAHLNYYSLEKHPIRKKDLDKTLSQWPELNKYKNLLLTKYPDLIEGSHHIHLANTTIKLTLLFSDVLEAMQLFPNDIDAWYLDGFSPKKNPSMWQPDILEMIAKHSSYGASFSSFTAATNVRKGLTKAGFIVNKQAGFGRKRDMLTGYLKSHDKTY